MALPCEGFIIYNKYSLQHILYYWSTYVQLKNIESFLYETLVLNILCVEQSVICFLSILTVTCSSSTKQRSLIEEKKMENFCIIFIMRGGIVSENLDLLFFVSISFMPSQIRMEIIHQYNDLFFQRKKNLLSFRFLVSMIFEYYIFIAEIQIQYFRVGWIYLTDRFANILKNLLLNQMRFFISNSSHLFELWVIYFSCNRFYVF